MMFLDASASPLLSFGGIDSASGILTDVLRTFLRFMDSGSQKVVDGEKTLCGILVAMQFFRFVARAGFSNAAMNQVLMGFIGAACWYTAAVNAVPLTDSWMSWMGSVGSMLSGGNIDADIMSDPSKFMGLGLKAFKAVEEPLNNLPLIEAYSVALPFLVVNIMIVTSYTLLGFLAIFVVLTTRLEVVIGIALLPFAIDDGLSFIGRKGVGMILEAGIEYGAMALGVMVSYGFLKEITLPPSPGFRDAINLLVSVGCCLLISGGFAIMVKLSSVAAKVSN